ncbi:MAG: hypothetical protein NZ700_14095 [Gemmataceae bacterium]|nr:hypothetical protein [Gemmataceae bacterium]MDW8265456.1 hypothetical protein [Gemmataceae bacterium]
MCGQNKLVKICGTSTGKLKHRIKCYTDCITALELSPDGSLLASGDRNGGIDVWEAESGGILFTLGGHKDCITGLSWWADSQVLASASEDGRVILWSAEDGFPVRLLNAHAADARAVGGGASPRGSAAPGVLSLAYARQGHLVTTGRDLSAWVWKPDGSPLAKLEGFSLSSNS